jgi:hypothetical protein
LPKILRWLLMMGVKVRVMAVESARRQLCG